jgi:hypothetical protein
MDAMLENRLNQQEENGFVVIKGALSHDEHTALAEKIRSLYQSGHDHGQNDVGTVWFDDVLDIEPGLFSALILHRSVRQELTALAGHQLQVRSLRGHYYPGSYKQHWHMDFYGYWDQAEEGMLASRGVALNNVLFSGWRAGNLVPGIRHGRAPPPAGRRPARSRHCYRAKRVHAMV